MLVKLLVVGGSCIEVERRDVDEGERKKERRGEGATVYLFLSTKLLFGRI